MLNKTTDSNARWNWRRVAVIALTLLVAMLPLNGSLEPRVTHAAPPIQAPTPWCTCILPNAAELGKLSAGYWSGQWSAASFRDLLGGPGDCLGTYASLDGTNMNVLVAVKSGGSVDGAKSDFAKIKQASKNDNWQGPWSASYGDEAIQNTDGWDRLHYVVFRRGAFLADVQFWIDNPSPLAGHEAQAKKIAAALDANLQASRCANPGPVDKDVSLSVNVSVVDPTAPPALSTKSAGDSLQFGEPLVIRVSISGIKPKDSTVVDLTGIGPLMVKLHYDGVQVASGQTQADGYFQKIDFPFTLPENTPTGRTKHQFLAAASSTKLQAAQTGVSEFEVWRGLQPISVSARSSSGEYLVGDLVTVTGYVYAGKFRLFSTPVKAEISAFAFGSSPVGTATTDASGYFKLVMPIERSGNWFAGLSLKAVPVEKNLYADGSAFLEFKVGAKGTLQATVATDKAVYQENDMLSFAGAVSTEGKPIAATVEIAVDGEYLTTVPTDAGGRYQYSFPIASLFRRQFFDLAIHHSLAVYPAALGYDPGQGAGAYFTVQQADATCQSGEIEVTATAGTPSATSPFAPQVIGFSSPQVSQGTKFPQGFIFETRELDRVTLSLPLNGNAGVKIVIDGKTSVKIAKYCRDASGRVKLLVHVSNPGRILVNVANPESTSLDYAIVTPTTTIKTVKTRYYIAVDAQGTTTVAALAGAVQVSDWRGSASLDLDAGKQITLGLDDAPRAANASALTAKIDPQLEEMLAGRSTFSVAPLVALAGGGAVCVGFSVLLGGFAIVMRSRPRRPRPSGRAPWTRPTELPERGAPRKPTDLPR